MGFTGVFRGGIRDSGGSTDAGLGSLPLGGNSRPVVGSTTGVFRDGIRDSVVSTGAGLGVSPPGPIQSFSFLLRGESRPDSVRAGSTHGPIHAFGHVMFRRWLHRAHQQYGSFIPCTCILAVPRPFRRTQISTPMVFLAGTTDPAVGTRATPPDLIRIIPLRENAHARLGSSAMLQM